MNNPQTQHIDQNPKTLIRYVRHKLDGNGLAGDWGALAGPGNFQLSAVLFLLTHHPTGSGGPPEPCLVLNKRSQKVLQPGDLCCPGGGIERLDKLLSYLFNLPLSHLRKWPAWQNWKSKTPKKAKGLSLLLSTALRESWEEMRLNPLRVVFMGPLPAQKLIMFNRQIIPLVGYAPQSRHLAPNWEVERIVYIPLRSLLDSQCYARYRLSFQSSDSEQERKEDFPCYVQSGCHGKDILWGATFRITMDFLKIVYSFELPDLRSAPVIKGRLGAAYLNGSLSQVGGKQRME